MDVEAQNEAGLTCSEIERKNSTQSVCKEPLLLNLSKLLSITHTKVTVPLGAESKTRCDYDMGFDLERALALEVFIY